MDHISALMDGELEDHNARAAFAGLKARDELREQWLSFHLIGDALRQDAQVARAPAEFLVSFHARLVQEPTVLAPRKIANRGVRRVMLSAAASIAAVAMVGWLALSENPLRPGDQLASRAPVIEDQTSTPAATNQVNDYLLAHQEFSPSTAIQGFAPYVRTVSETR